MATSVEITGDIAQDADLQLATSGLQRLPIEGTQITTGHNDRDAALRTRIAQLSQAAGHQNAQYVNVTADGRAFSLVVHGNVLLLRELAVIDGNNGNAIASAADLPAHITFHMNQENSPAPLAAAHPNTGAATAATPASDALAATVNDRNIQITIPENLTLPAGGRAVATENMDAMRQLIADQPLARIDGLHYLNFRQGQREFSLVERADGTVRLHEIHPQSNHRGDHIASETPVPAGVMTAAAPAAPPAAELRTMGDVTLSGNALQFTVPQGFHHVGAHGTPVSFGDQQAAVWQKINERHGHFSTFDLGDHHLGIRATGTAEHPTLTMYELQPGTTTIIDRSQQSNLPNTQGGAHVDLNAPAHTPAAAHPAARRVQTGQAVHPHTVLHPHSPEAPVALAPSGHSSGTGGQTVQVSTADQVWGTVLRHNSPTGSPQASNLLPLTEPPALPRLTLTPPAARVGARTGQLRTETAAAAPDPWSVEAREVGINANGEMEDISMRAVHEARGEPSLFHPTSHQSVGTTRTAALSGTSLSNQPGGIATAPTPFG